MRMWMVDPRFLCRKHLLGEHGEIHKHRHNFVKKHSIAKRIELGQIEPEAMQTRHDELAREMLKRGFNHQSDYSMPDLSYLPPEHRYGKVNIDAAHKDLTERCEECKKLTCQV